MWYHSKNLNTTKIIQECTHWIVCLIDHNGIFYVKTISGEVLTKVVVWMFWPPNFYKGPTHFWYFVIKTLSRTSRFSSRNIRGKRFSELCLNSILSIENEVKVRWRDYHTRPTWTPWHHSLHQIYLILLPDCLLIVSEKHI